jgi:hypothetical protein
LRPSYIQQPHHLSLGNGNDIPINEAFEIIGSSDVLINTEAEQLTLTRDGTGEASITLDKSICSYLPTQALIELDVVATQTTSMNIKLDKYELGRYRDVYWRRLDGGANRAVFALRADNCSGAKISLSRDTIELILSNLRVTEIRISQPGKPI